MCENCKQLEYKELAENSEFDKLIEAIELEVDMRDEYRFNKFWETYKSENKKRVEELINACSRLIDDNIYFYSDDGCLTTKEEDRFYEYVFECATEVSNLIIIK